jgi:hypothetical protein
MQKTTVNCQPLWAVFADSGTQMSDTTEAAQNSYPEVTGKLIAILTAGRERPVLSLRAVQC